MKITLLTIAVFLACIVNGLLLFDVFANPIITSSPQTQPLGIENHSNPNVQVQVQTKPNVQVQTKTQNPNPSVQTKTPITSNTSVQTQPLGVENPQQIQPMPVQNVAVSEIIIFSDREKKHPIKNLVNKIKKHFGRNRNECSIVLCSNLHQS